MADLNLCDRTILLENGCQDDVGYAVSVVRCLRGTMQGSTGLGCPCWHSIRAWRTQAIDFEYIDGLQELLELHSTEIVTVISCLIVVGCDKDGYRGNDQLLFGRL